MPLVEDFKEFVFKFVRYPKIYQMDDAAVTSLFQRIVGSPDNYVDKGTADNKYLVWDNSAQKFTPLTLANFKSLLGTFAGIVDPGSEFNKFLIWNNSLQKYMPETAANFMAEMFPEIFSDMVFWNASAIGQNTALLPCLSNNMSVPITSGCMVRSGTVNIGDNSGLISFNVVAQDKTLIPGNRLYVEMDDEQDGTYLSIFRKLSNQSTETIFSGKITSLHATAGVVLTLKTTPYIEPGGDEQNEG